MEGPTVPTHQAVPAKTLFLTTISPPTPILLDPPPPCTQTSMNLLPLTPHRVSPLCLLPLPTTPLPTLHTAEDHLDCLRRRRAPTVPTSPPPPPAFPSQPNDPAGTLSPSPLPHHVHRQTRHTSLVITLSMLVHPLLLRHGHLHRNPEPLLAPSRITRVGDRG